MISKEHKEQIISTLKRELGSASAVKDFSNTLRSLNLCDLKDDVQLEKAAISGALSTFETYYQLGILPKLIEIAKLIKEENNG